MNAIRLYARGRAHSAQGQRAAAAAALDSLKAILDATPADQMQGFQKTTDLLNMAFHSLSGEIAAQQGEFTAATQHLNEAIGYENGLAYDEPPPWFAPVRQTLGAVLLAAGKPGLAAQMYVEDLLHNPQNGWSLFGLAQAHRAEGRIGVATSTEALFRKAWARADVTLTGSRF